MKARRLVALSVVAIALACKDQTPTEPAAAKAPPDPSEIISDGAHGGNPDFFFLPPMVPLPVGNPNFELGKFNNTLRPSLTIEICELRSQNLNPQGRPTNATGCVGTDRFEVGSGGVPLKTFAPGTVKLVNLPVRENGWWNLFNLPPDGFYYVLWDTRQSNLNVNKYYRLKVFINGSRVPLGIADVDPIANLLQWKYTLTGEVVQMIDDVLLPIPFRVEKGGGPALCSGPLCTSMTVTNDNPNGNYTVLPVQGNNGPLAGAVFPDGWLPVGPGLPTSVVVTISSVNTGVNDVAAGTQEFPCHANLPLQQFNGCFKFTTTPPLDPVALGGHQFALAVTVVACFVLHDTDDEREPYVQLWSSGPNEPAHALVSESDVLVLTTETEHDCGSNFEPIIIGSNVPSNPVTRLASAGWAKVKAGFGQVFGVKTAYAVDVGLGGLTLDFSNVGPALTARIARPGVSDEGVILQPGVATAFTARMLGTKVHSASPTLDLGIPTMPVEFIIGECDGNLVGSENGRASRTTNADGFASVSLRVGSGTCSLTATGQALNETVTFTATAAALPVIMASSLVNGFGPSDLYGVQVGPTGVDTRIGQIRTAAGAALNITDIASLPGGALVGITFSQLYSIDRLTAIATLLGPLDRNDVNGLAANASGVLYASTLSGELVRRGDGGGWGVLGPFGGGLSSSGDLAFAPNGTLYGTLLTSSGVNVLASIDVSSGAATVISPASGLGFTSVWGLTFVGSNLYGLTNTPAAAGPLGQLIQINPSTGVGTPIRSLTFGAGGGAFNLIR